MGGGGDVPDTTVNGVRMTWDYKFNKYIPLSSIASPSSGGVGSNADPLAPVIEATRALTPALQTLHSSAVSWADAAGKWINGMMLTGGNERWLPGMGPLSSVPTPPPNFAPGSFGPGPSSGAGRGGSSEITLGRSPLEIMLEGGGWSFPTGASFHASGGLITEPIFGIGRSGARHVFGENGPETVTPGVGGGNTYHFTINAMDASGVRQAIPEVARQLDLHLKRTGGKGLT